jgi:hypothetical protein
MKTGHENKAYSRHTCPHRRPYVNNLAEAGADLHIVFRLAMDFARAAPDAPFLILIYIVVAHALLLSATPGLSALGRNNR